MPVEISAPGSPETLVADHLSQVSTRPSTYQVTRYGGLPEPTVRFIAVVRPGTGAIQLGMETSSGGVIFRVAWGRAEQPVTSAVQMNTHSTIQACLRMVDKAADSLGGQVVVAAERVRLSRPQVGPTTVMCPLGRPPQLADRPR
jgi:hypothetical protein